MLGSSAVTRSPVRVSCGRLHLSISHYRGHRRVCTRMFYFVPMLSEDPVSASSAGLSRISTRQPPITCTCPYLGLIWALDTCTPGDAIIPMPDCRSAGGGGREFLPLCTGKTLHGSLAPPISGSRHQPRTLNTYNT